MSERPSIRTLHAIPPAKPPVTAKGRTAGPPEPAHSGSDGPTPKRRSARHSDQPTPPRGGVAARTGPAADTQGAKPARISTSITLPDDDAQLLDRLGATYRRPRAAIIVALHHTYQDRIAIPDAAGDPLAANLPDGPTLADNSSNRRHTPRYIRAFADQWHPVVDAAHQRHLSVSHYVRRLLDQHRRANC